MATNAAPPTSTKEEKTVTTEEIESVNRLIVGSFDTDYASGTTTEGEMQTSRNARALAGSFSLEHPQDEPPLVPRTARQTGPPTESRTWGHQWTSLLNSISGTAPPSIPDVDVQATPMKGTSRRGVGMNGPGPFESKTSESIPVGLAVEELNLSIGFVKNMNSFRGRAVRIDHRYANRKGKVPDSVFGKIVHVCGNMATTTILGGFNGVANGIVRFSNPTIVYVQTSR